ncbi:VOC family protein [Ampullimonas aquatilis]|uniref:VOC family protein n=1 Tax=Ampullimonas aquatilis TaxID=1341549 RepID=UPI003C72BA98
MQLIPYLFFEGRCEEAVEFYGKVLGAEIVTLMRYKDNPEPNECVMQPEIENKIMHMSLRIGNMTLMASDGMVNAPPKFQGFSLSLTVEDAQQAEQFFNALAVTGQVQMPLGPTFFSPAFGMVADRFGVSWMIHVEPENN